MSKWKFQLASASLLDELSGTGGSRQDFSIHKEEPDDGHISYWLSSPWLDGSANKQALSDRLCALKCIIDGAIFVYSPPAISFEGILGETASAPRAGALTMLDRLRVESAVDIDAEERIFLPEGSAARGMDELRSATPPRAPRDGTTLFGDAIGAAVFLARLDKLTRGCLLCLGYSGVNYVSLYQCRDFMKRAPASMQYALGKNKLSAGEMKRFDHTANNFTATGPTGRHGFTGQVPPKVPMGVREARETLLPVIRAFIERRRSDVDIQQHWDALPP